MGNKRTRRRPPQKKVSVGIEKIEQLHKAAQGAQHLRTLMGQIARQLQNARDSTQHLAITLAAVAHANGGSIEVHKKWIDEMKDAMGEGGKYHLSTEDKGDVFLVSVAEKEDPTEEEGSSTEDERSHDEDSSGDGAPADDNTVGSPETS